MKIAIVGAGLFGCTAAIHAARAGHAVTLFDKAQHIMQGATRVNQFRLHRGYHYPRSPETVKECRSGLMSFAGEYGDAIVAGGEQYYAIARDTRTPDYEYQQFMDAHGLEYHHVVWRNLFDQNNVFNARQVKEPRIDYQALLRIVDDRLRDEGLLLRLGVAASKELRDRFDRIIVAGYAGTNEIAAALGCEPIELQYEVVEKPVVRLPPQYREMGCVVMDGPFGCVDPCGNGLHLMGHVDLAVKDRWIGTKGREVSDKASAFVAMRDALAEYLPFVRDAEHVDSLRTVRVVLPGRDATDERPTLVRALDDQVCYILAGKLGHAVEAAKQALGLLEDVDEIAA